MQTRTLVIGVAGAIALLGGGALGAGFLAQGWMAHRVDAALAAAPFTKVSRGALHYVLWTGRLDIDDLAIESTAPALRSLHAAHVELAGVGPGFLFGGGGDLRLAALSARAVDLAAADAHESAATLSLAGITFAAGGEPGATPSVADALARLSVERLELGDVHFRSDADDRDDTVASLAIDHLENGRVASLAATRMVLVNTEILGPGKVLTEMAELHAAGFDLLALRGLAPPEQDAKPLLVDSIGARGLVVTFANAAVSAEGVSLAGLQLPPDVPRPAGAEPLRPIATASLEHAEISNLAMAARSADTHMTVAHLALDKLRPGGVGRLALETVAMKDDKGIIGLGSLELVGLAIGQKMVFMGVPRFSLDRLHLADLSIGPRAGAEVAVKEVDCSMVGGLDNPSGGQFKLGPIVIPATLAPPLTEAGYNELVLDYDGSTHYDATEGVLEASQHLAGHDAGALTLSLRMEHYPAVSATSGESAAAMAPLLQAELAHLELRYDDASLADRLIRAYAARTGGDVESARARLLAALEARRAGFAAKPELLASLDALASFLREPHSLTLALAPPQPVAFGTLMLLARTSPDQLASLLGLSLR